MGIAVLGTMLERPFSFLERQFIFFCIPQNWKRKKNRRFIALRCDVFICIKYQSDLLQFIKTLLVYTGSLAKTPRREKAARFPAFAEINIHHGWPLVTPGKDFLLSIRLESVCVTQPVCMWRTRKYFLFLSQIEFRLSRQCLSVYCVIQWDSRFSHFDRWWIKF